MYYNKKEKQVNQIYAWNFFIALNCSYESFETTSIHFQKAMKGTKFIARKIHYGSRHKYLNIPQHSNKSKGPDDDFIDIHSLK
jgi:hypothetical protein